VERKFSSTIQHDSARLSTIALDSGGRSILGKPSASWQTLVEISFPYRALSSTTNLPDSKNVKDHPA